MMLAGIEKSSIRPGQREGRKGEKEMTTGQTTGQKEQIKVRYCKHEKEEYSLTLEINDRHISLTSHNYTHKPGNTTDITIFEMTPDDMMTLADRIRKLAYLLKGIAIEESLTNLVNKIEEVRL